MCPNLVLGHGTNEWEELWQVLGPCHKCHRCDIEMSHSPKMAQKGTFKNTKYPKNGTYNGSRASKLCSLVTTVNSDWPTKFWPIWAIFADVTMWHFCDISISHLWHLWQGPKTCHISAMAQDQIWAHPSTLTYQKARSHLVLIWFSCPGLRYKSPKKWHLKWQ